MEDQQYYIYDLETGDKIPCTKKQQEQSLELWESCKPKLRGSHYKAPIIFGTIQDNEFIDDISTFFTNLKQ